MTFRSTSARLLAAAALGGALLAVPALDTPAAAAPCPGNTVADPITGVCWSQSQGSIGITGTGGVCLPGRLGLCLAGVQNSQMPGANLPTNTGVGANRVNTWP
jgi:hypothetical protein